MKRVLPVLAVIMLLSTTAAFAEDGAGGPPPGAPPAQEGGQKGEGPRGDRPKMTEEQKKEMFPKKKAEVLAKMKERQACVEKSTDFESMHACMPKFGKHKRGGEGKGGWGKRGGEGRGAGGPGGEGPGGEE